MLLACILMCVIYVSGISCYSYHLISRFELNNMPEILHVKEADIESIIRRSLVIKFRARFFPAVYLQECLPNHEKYGIFARDPKLSDFLESGLGHAAALQTQGSWELENGEKAARDAIDHFHRCGGNVLLCVCVL